MPGDTVMTWLAIIGFACVGAALVTWGVRRLTTRPRLELTPTVESRRGADILRVDLLNLRSAPAEIRSAYLMFASGAGLALRPPLPGSAPLPLQLPGAESASLRYDFAATTRQLTHHPHEAVRGFACLVDSGELVERPAPPPFLEALRAAVAATAPDHLLSCAGCSDLIGGPASRG